MRNQSLPTLLIIEDQQFSLDLFIAAFKEYTVLTATTGEAGIEAFRNKNPDIVFLDLGLPDISGFEVLGQLLSINPDAYIVMLSAMNNSLYVKKSTDMGARGFLTKPYNKEYISYYITKYLEQCSTGGADAGAN